MVFKLVDYRVITVLSYDGGVEEKLISLNTVFIKLSFDVLIHFELR